MNCDCHVQRSAGSNAGKTVARRSPSAGSPGSRAWTSPTEKATLWGWHWKRRAASTEPSGRTKRIFDPLPRLSGCTAPSEFTCGISQRPCPLSQRLEEPGLRLGARREEARRAALAAAHRGAEEGAGCDRLMTRDRDHLHRPDSLPQRDAARGASEDDRTPGATIRPANRRVGELGLDPGWQSRSPARVSAIATS